MYLKFISAWWAVSVRYLQMANLALHILILITVDEQLHTKSHLLQQKRLMN